MGISDPKPPDRFLPASKETYSPPTASRKDCNPDFSLVRPCQTSHLQNHKIIYVYVCVCVCVCVCVFVLLYIYICFIIYICLKPLSFCDSFLSQQQETNTQTLYMYMSYVPIFTQLVIYSHSFSLFHFVCHSLHLSPVSVPFYLLYLDFSLSLFSSVCVCVCVCVCACACMHTA